MKFYLFPSINSFEEFIYVEWKFFDKKMLGVNLFPVLHFWYDFDFNLTPLCKWLIFIL